jgi:hypothetical protein
MKKPEQALRDQVTMYLKLAYPSVMYKVDLESDIKLNAMQGARNKKLQCGRGWPDLFIAHPSKGFHGLFIELKATEIYLKDGKTLRSNEHLKEQNEVLWQLTRHGYKAVFGVGFDQTRKIIDEYLK